MVDLPLLVISRATCGIRIEDEISFAWPADHVNSISTGYNGFSSCVYRFEGEHDEIVKLRFNKLLNGNRTCRSVSSPDFNRLLCVGSENFFVKVGLIVSFNPCWINFRLVRIRMEKSYAIIYLRRFRFKNIFLIRTFIFCEWILEEKFLYRVCNVYFVWRGFWFKRFLQFLMFSCWPLKAQNLFQIFPFLDLFRDNNAARVPINLRNELWMGIAPFYICTTRDR